MKSKCTRNQGHNQGDSRNTWKDIYHGTVQRKRERRAICKQFTVLKTKEIFCNEK